MLAFNKKKLFLLLVVCFCLVSAADATVSLERTIKSDGSKNKFENVSVMLPGTEGTLLIVDSERGVLTEFKGNAGVTYKLSGDGKAFGSERVSGLSRIDAERFVVSNSDEGKVVIIDAQGKLIQTLVVEGSEAGLVSNPTSVAWSANRRLYVADKGNNRISVFGIDGVFIQTIGQVGLSEEKRLSEPELVYVDQYERVYVLEKRNQGIVSIFNQNGELIKQITAKDIKKMAGSEPELSAMTIDETGLIYLADNNNGRIYLIDWQAMKMKSSFGSKGEQRGQFENITSIVKLPGNKLAVADSENKKIEIYRLPLSNRQALKQKRLPTVGYERIIKLKCNDAYRLEGGNVLCLNDDKVATYKSSGKHVITFKAEFNNPVAASIDDQDVIILDGESIKIFKLDGRLRYKAGASGSADGQLDSPQGVYLGKDKIYVADTGNNRIQIFSKDGIFLSKITNPASEKEEKLFESPTKVVVDASNNMYVLDAATNKVSVLSPKHNLLYKISGDAKLGGAYEKIYDIAIDQDNNLYILCATSDNRSTVHVYSGPTKTISFGASTELSSGVQSPASLSIAPARKTVVSVYDKEKSALLNFKYMQLPSRVGGLQVDGSIKETKLSWGKAPGSYISRYKVYASREKDGPYKYLTDVSKTKAVVQHKSASTNNYYAVSAISGFSVEGRLSNVREDAFQAGYSYYKNLEYDKAYEVFSAAFVKDKNNGEVLKYLGLSTLELNKTDDAVAYFRELSLLSGYEAEGLNLQIRALVAIADYVAAKAVVDKVIADNTASTDTIVYCGELSLKLGDAIGAIDCLEKALAVDKNNIKAHFLIGQAYVKLGIIDQGLNEFKIAESIDPENADVLYQSGLVYQQLNKHDEAVKRLVKAVAKNGQHYKAKLALAESQLQLKQYDQVRTIAIQLAGQSDTAAKGQYLLGVIALANKQNGKALLALTKSTRADKTNATSWMALAYTYELMGQGEKVRSALLGAFEGDPNSFEAAYRLGEYDYEAGDYKQAITSLERSVLLKPDGYDARFKLADAQYRTGLYKQAMGHAQTSANLNKESKEPLVLLANLSNKQGKTGKAIDYIKQAMGKEKNSADLHTLLGELYVSNSIYDLAKSTLGKAILLDPNAAKPHVLLGTMYSGRRLFDDAITALDKAVSLDPSAENKLALDTAYAEKKKAAEFKSNKPQIVLKDLRLERVFSAAYKQYATKPVGSIRIQNASGQDYGNLKLTFTIKGYMDFPTTISIEKLKANTDEVYELNAVFNNKVLEIDEDTGVQVEVAVRFVRDGRKDSISLTQPMTIYGKNAIVWGNPNMIGSFVTPKDDLLRDFVRQTINQNKPKADAIDNTLLTAMTLFDVLTAHGIKYIVDPNSPYADVSENSIDYVQFGRETLKLKSGDCDDLSVLLSASLENLGIETAILDVPAHLLMMFNTGLSEAERGSISLDDDLLVIRDGQVWLPIEATMLGTASFAEAWAEGARKYHDYSSKNELKVITLKDAWAEFKPVTLKPATYTVSVPDKSHVAPLVVREKNILLEKSLDRLVSPYKTLVGIDPSNAKAHMQIAIIYAKNGLTEAAEKAFEEILKINPDDSGVPTNRGNMYFGDGDYERAIEQYNYAERLASNDAGIKMNLSMAHYKDGNLVMASTKYEEAIYIDSAIGKKYATFVKLLSK